MRQRLTNHPNERDQHRERVRSLVARGAMSLLARDGTLPDRMIVELSEQLGLHPHAIARIFESREELHDEVYTLLVNQCAERV